MSVLILGDSHIRRLEHFVLKRHPNNPFCLQGPVIPVHFHGISGGRITNRHHIQFFETSLQQFHPNRIILSIGGNDLDVQDLNLDTVKIIVHRLISLSQLFIQRHGATLIVIPQLLSRDVTRNCSVQNYNAMVIAANRMLKEELKKVPNVQYWKLKGLKYAEDLLVDGVHLTSKSQVKYYRNIRGAIINCFNK